MKRNRVTRNAIAKAVLRLRPEYRDVQVIRDPHGYFYALAERDGKPIVSGGIYRNRIGKAALMDMAAEVIDVLDRAFA